MVNKGKIDEQTKRKAVAEYEAGAKVTELAKKYGVSQPGFYLWVKKFGKAARATSAAAGAATPARNETLEQRCARLERENLELKARLYDLLMGRK